MNQRIGIVTLPGHSNYGNRLQNFALQEALGSLGFTAESIVGLPRAESTSLRLRRLLPTAWARRNELAVRLLKPGASAEIARDEYVIHPERGRAIQAFSQTHIRPAPEEFVTGVNVHELVEQYSHFVVGSDQVWNPAYTHGNPEWFLSFAKPKQRVAYAASIGIPELPAYLRSRYGKGFRGIEKLSVREHRSADIVGELTGSRPPVVLDPTMLLSSEKWGELAVLPEVLSADAYIATFMLSAGDTAPAAQHDLQVVDEFAREQGLGLVDLHNPDRVELLGIGPLEFIGAIRHASLVVTDSFHATVFAILFNRPFVLAPRGQMNSRFETLMAHTGISAPLLGEVRDPEVLESSLDIDWNAVEGKLVRLRRESLGFLKDSLGAL